MLARGNAVDAVIAGVLAAAAESPSVLLGPFQMLAGGAGAGLLAIDGRIRQPGLGVPRPRGFLFDEAVPDAARVGVPTLPAAIATALASVGTVTLLRAAGSAIERARVISPERAAVLEAFARRGSAAFASDAIGGELTAAAGRAARGLLTAEDLSAVRPTVVSCSERSLGPSGVLAVPWRGGTSGGAWPDASCTQVVVACDARGRMAVACYEVPDDGVSVQALGLIAPRHAAPVMRGKKRLRPGEPCDSAAPIALRSRRGKLDLALGIAANPDAEQALENLIAELDDTAAAVIAARRNGCSVAVVQTA
jgi:gamma-glutamyltranspeptidase/glutathione hydrolase